MASVPLTSLNLLVPSTVPTPFGVVQLSMSKPSGWP
jgi:hypothetical protein